jgi:hypothetical protein
MDTMILDPENKILAENTFLKEKLAQMNLINDALSRSINSLQD